MYRDWVGESATAVYRRNCCAGDRLVATAAHEDRRRGRKGRRRLACDYREIEGEMRGGYLFINGIWQRRESWPACVHVSVGAVCTHERQLQSKMPAASACAHVWVNVISLRASECNVP